MGWLRRTQKCGVIPLAWAMWSDAERKIIGNLDDLGAVNADNSKKTAGLEHLAGTSPGFLGR